MEVSRCFAKHVSGWNNHIVLFAQTQGRNWWHKLKISNNLAAAMSER
jgi:hypothetical protein